jgi:hypothetical protein
VVSVRFGCDEAPCDPATDPALAARFSSDAPAGKAECRKALARRTSLALGRRTLLVATAPLAIAEGGRALIDAISSLVRSDVAFVVPGRGERALVDEIKRIAIETPGKIAIYPETGPAAERQILAGADVLLLADKDNHLARTAGTGHALRDPAARSRLRRLRRLHGRLRCRLANRQRPALPAGRRLRTGVRGPARGRLRGNPDVWQPLQNRLMRAAPHWAATAALFEGLCLSQPASV